MDIQDDGPRALRRTIGKKLSQPSPPPPAARAAVAPAITLATSLVPLIHATASCVFVSWWSATASADSARAVAHQGQGDFTLCQLCSWQNIQVPVIAHSLLNSHQPNRDHLLEKCPLYPDLLPLLITEKNPPRGKDLLHTPYR